LQPETTSAKAGKAKTQRKKRKRGLMVVIYGPLRRLNSEAPTSLLYTRCMTNLNDLQQIREFVRNSELGSISAAAKVLSMGRPTLSLRSGHPSAGLQCALAHGPKLAMDCAPLHQKHHAQADHS
jgi:hypothetical protein